MKRQKKKKWKTFTRHLVKYDRVIITSDLTRPFQNGLSRLYYYYYTVSEKEREKESVCVRERSSKTRWCELESVRSAAIANPFDFYTFITRYIYIYIFFFLPTSVIFVRSILQQW